MLQRHFSLSPCGVRPRRDFSASATPSEAPPPSLASASTLSRVPILLGLGSVTRLAEFCKSRLGLAPGQKCVVVASPTGAARAAIAVHFLRRGGFLPLLVPLPESAPTEAAVQAVVGAGKRTGATFVVGFGGGAALNVAKAAAAVLGNGGDGSPGDFDASLGGKRTLARPSLPVLTVPSCPSGEEVRRGCHVLGAGGALAALTPHPSSPLGCVVDPGLALSLPLSATTATGFVVVMACAEALLRLDSDAGGRALAYEGLQRGVNALSAVTSGGKEALTPQLREQLAISSVLAGALTHAGPLGAARGLALTLASRLSVPYSGALAAIGPGVLIRTLDVCLEAYDDEDTQAAAHALARQGGYADLPPAMRDAALAEDAAAGGAKPRPGAATAAPSSRRMRRTLRAEAAEESSIDNEIADEGEAGRAPFEDAAAVLGDGVSGGGGGGAGRSEDTLHARDDADSTLARLVLVGGALRVAADAAGGAPPPLQRLGGRAAVSAGADPQADLAGFERLLCALLEGGGAIGGSLLEDLSDLDLQAVAEAAEVEPNTLAHVVPLSKADLLDILKTAREGGGVE